MYIRTSITFIVSACIICFLLGCMLTCNLSKPKTVTNTIKKTDTVRVEVKGDTVVKEKLVPVRVVVPSMARVDSFIQFEKADTAAILASCKVTVEDYLSQKTYKEQYRFDDGVIDVETVTSKNEVVRQSVNPTFLKTIITESITVQNKRKNEVYLGADGYYSRERVGVGVSLMFLHKKGWGIEAGSSINQFGGIEYRAAYKRKLSLK